MAIIGIAIKQPLKFIVQHYLNSLHIYSIMCRLRFCRAHALKMAYIYERFVHPFLYIKKEKNKGGADVS